jgi:hypothetical protein
MENPENPAATAFVCNEIGITMGNTKVRQLEDGTWEATCPIGTLFGYEVTGNCRGSGPTREAALAALEEDRRQLNESIWV